MAFLAGAPDTAQPRQREPYREPPDVGGSEYRSVRLLGAVSGTPVFGTPTERIGMIAAGQRGLVSRGQLLAAGVASTTIDRHVASKRLLTVHRGVFRAGHDAPVELGAETAALLAVREGAMLSHCSAAVHLEIALPRIGDGLIHLTVPGSPGGRPNGVRVHRSTILTDRDGALHRGLPVTSAARALLDNAPSLTGRELERALDQALIMRLTTLRAINELLHRCGRHLGRRALQVLVGQYTTTTFTRSEAEERFLALVREAQLPRPLVNVRRHGFEIDFLWPEQRLAVEIDGYRYHGGGTAFERDRRRDAVLKAAGIDTIRITWRQLQNEPVAVIARFAQAFAAAPR